MNTMAAFMMGQATKDHEAKVFDWDKAARLIRERQPESASAGLSDDWSATGGTIYENGKPVPKEDTYTYLASTWATPELEMDGEVVDCYVMQSQTEWDRNTYWPKSALDILKGGSNEQTAIV